MSSFCVITGRERGYPGVDGEFDELNSTWQLRLNWLGILDQLVELMEIETWLCEVENPHCTIALLTYTKM
jgi:hypothetical protein